LFMFKYYNSLLPPLFDSFFALNVDVHSYFFSWTVMAVWCLFVYIVDFYW